MRELFLAPAFLLAASCVQTTKRLPPDLFPRHVRELMAWQVGAGDRAVGRLARVRIEDPSVPEELYLVQNTQGQWVGWIDLGGRVFRREPFQDEAVLVTTTTVQKGVGLLLNASAPVELRAVEKKPESRER